jgi:MoxR-like ATPase
MSTAPEEVREALMEGDCMLCVLSAEPFAISRYLLEKPVEIGQPGEVPDSIIPVFYWDALDGLSVPGELEEPPEGMDDPLRALGYAGQYGGEAIFIFNLDDVDVEAEEDAFRRQAKSLASRFTPAARRALVLASSTPLPASVARLFRTLGYPEEVVETRRAAAAPQPQSSRWREIRQLQRFDSFEWRRTIDDLEPAEVEEIIDGDYHEEALNRVNALRDALKRQFARKDEIIDLMAYAAVAQIPMVLLGPPGTAKSNMVRNFCRGVGLSSSDTRAEGPSMAEAAEDAVPSGFFEYLLTRYTTPEEVFGPVHIGELIENGVYRRVTAGRLPEAEIAFLDEIFKASSAIVNTLLSILNERIFHNGREVQQVPLIMVFAASNEPPQDPQLGALYDRFPIRANCASIEGTHAEELLRSSWELNYDREFAGETGSMPQVACTNDLRLLHRVSLVQFGGRRVRTASGLGAVDFPAEFLRLFLSLRRDFGISDRTVRSLFLLARSMALLEGRSHLTVNDLDVFRYVSWDEAGTGELNRLVSNLKRGVSM